MTNNGNPPLVSVIIPSFNRANTLNRAIHSVLYQTFNDLEVIIVDDASSDNTYEVVKKLKSKDQRIRYFKHNKNMGAAAARNTGINNQKGKYIAFLDSDDLWLPDKLEKQINAFSLAASNIGVVYTNFIRYEGDSVLWKDIFRGQKNGYIYYGLLFNNYVITSTMLVKSSCFEDIGLWDENLPCYQDWDLSLRLAKSYKFMYLPEHLVIQYDQFQSITNSHRGKDDAALYLMEKYYSDISKDNRIISNFQILVAKSSFLNRRYYQSLNYFIKGIYNNPFRLKNYLFMIASFLGISNYLRIRKLYRHKLL